MDPNPGLITPGVALRDALEEKGWTQEELAIITGTSRMTVSNIIAGRTGITPDMAVSLAAAFGNDPSEWLNLDTVFRLSQVTGDPLAVRHKALLFRFAPIREMQRRGWINETNDASELEQELKRFFQVSSLEYAPEILVATRRVSRVPELTPQQRAWCFRARQMAGALTVRRFLPARLHEVLKEVRGLAAYVKEVQHLPQLLADYGVRFVIVEPLAGAKIDGAAFWLDENSPVIAVSVRYDRIDAFWFTVLHELSHISHQDALSVDSQLTVDTPKDVAKDSSEQRADREASSTLVPKAEMDSFIRRVGPLYSKVRIIQFAHRIKIHPGIVIGQLQHSGEIGYRTHREMLVRVRDIVTAVALTDGWGKSMTPGLL
jgi:HTH-type transcriptional regulator/antitoxin HigA